jgi:hypothetical protein
VPIVHRFSCVAEIVLFRPAERVQINPSELKELCVADTFRDKKVGLHLITIRGPGRSRYMIGDTLAAMVSFKNPRAV